MSAMKRQLTCAELAVADGAHQHVWDALWRGESIGRVAVFVCPGNATIMSMRERYTFALADVETPRGYTEAWRQGLLDELYYLAACRSLPGDCSPALHVPRHLHGQTQGFADLFGARVEVQPDGNFFPYPLPDDPAVIDALEARPLETSRYWTAVEWLNYARAATGGLLPFHNPVMTGPLDTANYLLGSTTLLEWVYTEPEVIHRLLAKITDAIIRMLRALQAASGGFRHSMHSNCSRGGFGLCSELRALVSTGIYQEFEAPYLQQIGEQLGTFAVHSCGSWERTLPSVRTNPYLRVMNGPIKENDLPTLCEYSAGEVLLSLYHSQDVHEEYLWPDMESYYRHVLTITPADQPLEINDLPEADVALWLKLQTALRGDDTLLQPLGGELAVRSKQ